MEDTARVVAVSVRLECEAEAVGDVGDLRPPLLVALRADAEQAEAARHGHVVQAWSRRGHITSQHSTIRG